MIHLGAYEIFEIFIGILFWWIGIYLLSRNPYAPLSWLTFGLLAAFAFIFEADPIYTNTRTPEEYIKWQKIIDWSLFFAPIFYFHASLFFKTGRKRFQNYLLILGYVVAFIFYTLHIKGGLIVKEGILRMSDFKYNFAFDPGVLLWPAVIFESTYLALAVNNFFQGIKKNFWKYFLPALGGTLYIISANFLGIAYHIIIPFAVIYFNTGAALGTLLVIYSVVRYHLFAPSEKIIFGRDFLYLTLGIVFIIALYLGGFFISGISLNFPALVFLLILLVLVLTTHCFYDWLTTFVRDVVYNISSGLSIVNDEEVYQALRNYNKPDRLEDSPLLRLNLINQNIRKGEAETPVDALRGLIKEAIEYFKPEQDKRRRTKQNLKYHLLKMLAFNQVEEGQILWELGFEEYPLRIMAKETEARPPLFKPLSPSDYTYTSRNAFMALKREAVHDIAWRISYLEKLSKKKII